MIRVTVDEAKERLHEMIEAALRGEIVHIDVVDQQGKREVRLLAISAGLPERGFGSMRGTFTIADNFDDPLEDFKDYQITRNTRRAG